MKEKQQDAMKELRKQIHEEKTIWKTTKQILKPNQILRPFNEIWSKEKDKQFRKFREKRKQKVKHLKKLHEEKNRKNTHFNATILSSRINIKQNQILNTS